MLSRYDIIRPTLNLIDISMLDKLLFTLFLRYRINNMHCACHDIDQFTYLLMNYDIISWGNTLLAPSYMNANCYIEISNEELWYLKYKRSMIKRDRKTYLSLYDHDLTTGRIKTTNENKQ